MITRVNNHATDRDKCDAIFSKLVTSRGVCVHCGTTDKPRLQCSHIIPRRFNATRTDLDNALCLCYKCHHFYTINPLRFTEFVKSTIGEAEYDRLWEKARAVTKVSWSDELIRLKKLKDSY